MPTSGMRHPRLVHTREAMSCVAGLDVHDVSENGPVPAMLKPGNCVTCEPGIYFSPSVIDPALADPSNKGLLNVDRLARFTGFGGVRLEDNIVVLQHGNHNLTGAVPRDIEAVENAALGSASAF